MDGAGSAIEQSEVVGGDVAGEVEVLSWLCGLEGSEVEVGIGWVVFAGWQERPRAADAGAAEPAEALEFFDNDGGVAAQLDTRQPFVDFAERYDWGTLGGEVGKQSGGPPGDATTGYLCLSPFHVSDRTVNGSKCKRGKGECCPPSHLSPDRRRGIIPGQ